MTSSSLGIYVHWPFCLVKCPYCDFNSQVRNSVDYDSWNKALLGELREAKKLLGNRRVESIFFGGGTPSLMPPYIVKNIIDEVKNSWLGDHNIEITIEANPGTLDEARFRQYASSGVDRISLGVQSFQDKHLKFLGRNHLAKDAKRAINFAGKVFKRISIDLIYGLPEQTLSDWESELTQGIDFAQKSNVKHISLYQLTIEKGTHFHTAHRLRKFTMPNPEKQYDFFNISNRIAKDMGLPPYEVSNYATKCEESRHNVRVWQYRDYLGIGPGAHSRFRIDGHTFARSNYRLAEKWLSQQKAHYEGVENIQKIENDSACEEYIMMGLRLYQGIKKSTLEKRFNGRWSDMFKTEKLEVLVKGGDIIEDCNYIMASEQGISRLDRVILHFVDAMNRNFWDQSRKLQANG